MSSFATLQRLARKAEPAERCGLCGLGLGQHHQHLIDPATRRLVCSCEACSLLFYEAGATKYRRVPRTARLVRDVQISDGQWENLMIPIGLAFFVESSAEKRVLALYPSPAGAMESLLSLEAWTDIVTENPMLSKMQPDVEALLVNRLEQEAEYYIAPIDKCYELVGLIRGSWHGFTGGTEVWVKIRKFLKELKEDSYA